MADIISAKHLFKEFKEIVAINDLSFSVPEGKIYGFLGQNGAGKSTTIRMLLSLVTPSGGEIEIFGLNLKKNRKEILKKVGAVIERPDLYKYLSAVENLSMFAAMSGVKMSKKQLVNHLETVGLAERAASKVKTYSQGMKQRLGIGIALVNDPELVILDEPMNGLDPQGIADVRNLILHLSKDLNKTLFISSHLLSEMELVADSMLIIDRGKKVVEGTMTELFNPAQTVVELHTRHAVEVYEKITRSGLKDQVASQKGDRIFFRVHQNQAADLIKRLVQLDIDIISLNSKHSLENYFLSLTTENQHVDSFKD